MTAKFRSKNIADLLAVAAVVVGMGVALQAQGRGQTAPPPPTPSAPTPGAPAAAQAPTQGVPPAVAPTTPAGIPIPTDYVIGAEDVLQIVYWRDKDMSTSVAVRPDGKISLPLLNDVQAAGLTPAQLRDKLTEASKKFIEDPTITVVVDKMNSRKVFITGEVEKPGPYPLIGPTTVLQLIALAGGHREFADSKNIVIVRVENGKSLTYLFNYKDVASRRNLNQNIELKSG